jgi:hypothetical protein
VSYKYLWSLAVGVLITSLITQTALAHIGESAPSAYSSTRSVDPRVEALARQWFVRFQTGDIDRSQLDQRVNEQLTSTMIKREEKTLRVYGAPLSFVFVESEHIKAMTGYYFVLNFRSGRIVEGIVLNPDHSIAGIDFMTFVPDKTRHISFVSRP